MVKENALDITLCCSRVKIFDKLQFHFNQGYKFIIILYIKNNQN